MPGLYFTAWHISYNKMTTKEKLIALCITFGLAVEGLTIVQLQQELDDNAGYKAYEEQLQRADAATAALAKVDVTLTDALEGKAKLEAEKVELEGDLRTANNTINDLEYKLELLTPAEPTENKLMFIAADGTNYEVTVSAFRYKGENIDTADAIANRQDIMQDLLDANTYFFKKI